MKADIVLVDSAEIGSEGKLSLLGGFWSVIAAGRVGLTVATVVTHEGPEPVDSTALQIRLGTEAGDWIAQASGSVSFAGDETRPEGAPTRSIGVIQFPEINLHPGVHYVELIVGDEVVARTTFLARIAEGHQAA